VSSGGVDSGVPRILEWEGRGATGAKGWEGVSPSPLGEGSRKGAVLTPQKIVRIFC